MPVSLMTTRLIAWTVWAAIVGIAAYDAWMIGRAFAIARTCS